MITGIYAITPGRTNNDMVSLRQLVAAMEDAAQGGVGAIQIREKHATSDWLLALAIQLIPLGYGRPITSRSDPLSALNPSRTRPLLILNGACVPHWPWHLLLPDALHLSAGNAQTARRHLAEAAGCGALRLPCIWSAHDPMEARAALDQGAAAVTISPIYPTTSHPGQSAGGIDLLRKTVDNCPGRKVIALGGIGPGRVAACRQAGASAVAVISGVFGQDSVTKAAKTLVEEWSSACHLP